MELAEVVGPAIRLAESGFAVSEKLAPQLQEHKAGLEKFPASRRIFLNDGKMWQAGDTLKQPELAATLKRIAKDGAEEFYAGETAGMGVGGWAKFGGFITLGGLAAPEPSCPQTLPPKHSPPRHHR